MRFARLMFVSWLAAAPVAAQRADTVVRRATLPTHAGVAELRPELRIGVADGDENYMLGAINDIAVAANGTMYVLDRSVPTVRVYDAAGKFMKNVGRKGGGPGEYGYASGIALASNGNLLIYDSGNARINVYSPTGDAVTSWPTHSSSTMSSGRGILVVDTAGTIYVRKTIWRADQGSAPRSAWVRFGANGVLRDTTFGPELPSVAILTARSEGSFLSNGVPFAPSNHAAISPLGYFVTGQSSRLAVDLHEPNKAIVSIRRDVPLKPVTARERDSARADVIASMRRTDPAWSWNGPDIPRTKAAFSGLRAGADGLIWVELDRGPRFDDGSGAGRGQPTVRMGAGQGRGRGGPSWACPTDGWSLYDVYEPTGRYRGQVRLPEKINPIALRGDFVWAAACNEDDAPQVVRYRIVWR